MTSGKLSKRVVVLGMMVTMATMLVILLQLTSFNPAVAITTRVANEDIQPLADATPREPMTDRGLSFESMSPAEALSNGKPTLFFFQPYELCQSRYCHQPQMMMADELQAEYQDSMNFVYVTIYGVSDYASSEPYPQLHFDNWDLYVVPPYSEWVPKPTMTEFGLSLQAPVVLLIDSAGNLVYQGNEFFTINELEPGLQVLIGEQADVSLAKLK